MKDNIVIRKITTEDLKTDQYKITDSLGGVYTVSCKGIGADSSYVSFRYVACKVNIVSCEVGKDLLLACPGKEIIVGVSVEKIEKINQKKGM